MITFRPLSSAVEAYSASASGVRWALATLVSKGMPSSSRVLAACFMVSQSEREPMITPTTGPVMAASLAPKRPEPNRGQLRAHRDVGSAQPYTELVDRGAYGRPLGRRCARFGIDAVHVKHPSLAIEPRIDAPDQPVAVKDGQDEVPELPLGLRERRSRCGRRSRTIGGCDPCPRSDRRTARAQRSAG